MQQVVAVRVTWRLGMFAGNNASGLQLVKTLPLRNSAPIWLLTHPDLRRTPKVRNAMRFLAQHF